MSPAPPLKFADYQKPGPAGKESYCTGAGVPSGCNPFDSTATTTLTVVTATGKALSGAPYVSPDFTRVGELDLAVTIPAGMPSGSPFEAPSFDLQLSLWQSSDSYAGVGWQLTIDCM